MVTNRELFLEREVEMLSTGMSVRVIFVYFELIVVWVGAVSTLWSVYAFFEL